MEAGANLFGRPPPGFLRLFPPHRAGRVFAAQLAAERKTDRARHRVGFPKEFDARGGPQRVSSAGVSDLGNPGLVLPSSRKHAPRANHRETGKDLNDESSL